MPFTSTNYKCKFQSVLHFQEMLNKNNFTTLENNFKLLVFLNSCVAESIDIEKFQLLFFLKLNFISSRTKQLFEHKSYA